MSSDTSDGGAPLYSPAEPPKETQPWSSMRLAAVKARENSHSGAAEAVAARPAEVAAASLDEGQEVTKPETPAGRNGLGTLNVASSSSLSKTAAAIKEDHQVSILQSAGSNPDSLLHRSACTGPSPGAATCHG